MKRVFWVLCCIAWIGMFLGLSSGMMLAESKRIDAAAKISAVTVFQDRAQVTRTFKLTVEPGIYTVVFSHIPMGINEQSVRVSGEGTAVAKILDIQTKNQFLKEAFAEQSRQLEADKKKNEKELKVLADRKVILEKKEKYLNDLMEKFADSQAGTDKPRVLSTTEFTNLLNYMESRLEEIAAKKREIAEKTDALQKENNEISGKLALNSKGEVSIDKSVYTELDVRKAGELNLSMSYVIPGASWSPVYDIRVSSKEKNAALNCSAIVTQETGEDWENIRLHLSTAKPMENKSLPELKPYYINAINSNEVGVIKGVITLPEGAFIPGVSITLSGEQTGTRKIYSDKDGKYRFGNLPPGIYRMKIEFPGFLTQNFNMIEVLKGKLSILNCQLEIATLAERVTSPQKATIVDMDASLEQTSNLEPLMELSPETTNVSQGVLAAEFVLKHPDTVPSSSEGKKVTISLLDVPAEKEYIVFPSASSTIFLKAKIKNTGQSILLPGPLSVFFDGMFINTSQLSLLHQDETLDLPMGIDESVKVERIPFEDESMKKGLFKKKTELPSGFVIKLKNLKQIPIQVKVSECIPVSKNKKVKVEVPVMNPKPDSFDTEKGFLSWNI